ncbi:MAG: bifunctional hydroxymethylpyrimidine kinase/phosphomethylpyrimidine kinase [Mariprofundaceae bacterium]
MNPVCLTIGGSDSSAGAGVQADLNTFSSHGMKGCSAITALTAQTPVDISRIENAPLEQLEAEIRAIFAYYEVKAVKTGMLVDAERIRLIASLLGSLHFNKLLIVDPVMVSTSKTHLLDDDGVRTLWEKLFPLATLITPNIPEAECLLGRSASDPLEDVAELVMRTKTAVLLKGGHGQGDHLMDVLCERTGEVSIFEHNRRDWDKECGHGSGCCLASAITTHLAMGLAVDDAVQKSIDWLQERS